jgi:hypothetical protein
MMKKLIAALLGSALFAVALAPAAFAGDKTDDTKKEAPKDDKK